MTTGYNIGCSSSLIKVLCILLCTDPDNQPGVFYNLNFHPSGHTQTRIDNCIDVNVNNYELVMSVMADARSEAYNVR